jgi:hypothetical protein
VVQGERQRQAGREGPAGRVRGVRAVQGHEQQGWGQPVPVREEQAPQGEVPRAEESSLAGSSPPNIRDRAAVHLQMLPGRWHGIPPLKEHVASRRRTEHNASNTAQQQSEEMLVFVRRPM